MDISFLPENFTASVLDLSGDVIESLMPIIILIIGVILGFFIVERVIGIFRPE